VRPPVRAAVEGSGCPRRGPSVESPGVADDQQKVAEKDVAYNVRPSR